MRTLVGLTAALLITASALAEDVYYSVPLKDVITSAQFEQLKAPEVPYDSENYRSMSYMAPYAIAKAQEEMYVVSITGIDNPYSRSTPSLYSLVVRCPQGAAPSGTIFLPKDDYSRMLGFDFTLTAPSTDQSAARNAFFLAKERHYSRLWNLQRPGSAWFRHQMLDARSKISKSDSNAAPLSDDNRPSRFDSGSDFDRTFAIFSGTLALSENLQLDRQLRIAAGEPQTIDVNILSGITTAAIDWKPLIKGLAPKKDVLAAFIPADQHAILFATYNAMDKATARANTAALPFAFLMGQTADNQSKARSDRQLCLETDTLSRIVAPRIITSMAFTASDLAVQSGTDNAVLFEASNPGLLYSSIVDNHKDALAAVPSTKKVKGLVLDVNYVGAVSPDRTISSYLIRIDNIIIVANSLTQLEKIVRAHKTLAASLSAADEYTFFRDRYKHGATNETALVVVPDAAIRRWCSPQWRIADSRRVRAAAALAELQARHLDELVAKAAPRILEPNNPDLGQVSLTATGVYSNRYGSLAFLTPIVELPVTKVTPSEQRGYQRFRDSYQSNWRGYFDPIALRVHTDSGLLDLDLSIRPLIAQSEYHQFISIAGKAGIGSFSGDKHPGSLFHAIIALDSNSAPVREFGSFAVAALPTLQGHPFSWVGNWLSLYADDDPYWNRLADNVKKSGFKNADRFLAKLPLALEVDVADSFRLAAFLVAARAMIEQTTPNMLKWQTIQYNDQSYVKVSPASQLPGLSDVNGIALCYYAGPRRFILALNEDLLKRAIARATAPAEAPRKKDKAAVQSWLGKSLGLEFSASAVTIFDSLAGESLDKNLQRASWSNIPILNEWHSRYPNIAPAEVEQQFWNFTLRCPGGGKYVWNDKLKTMESTVFGSPASPKTADIVSPEFLGLKDLRFGLTFEENGLRARAQFSTPK